MPTPAPEIHLQVPRTGAVLRLLVRNHPGVMSHVCGLFARRAFNVEGILCLPHTDGARSIVLLLVHEDVRLDQLISQLGKVADVLEIHRVLNGHAVFAGVATQLATSHQVVDC